MLTGSAAGGLFHAAGVVAPSFLVDGREVVTLLQQSGRTVDQFADNVGVPGVPLGLRCHMGSASSASHGSGTPCGRPNTRAEILEFHARRVLNEPQEISACRR
jgi:hypothetical protein